MNPFQCHHLIHETQILRVRVILTIRQVEQMEKSEYPNPVFDGGDNDIRVLFYEIVSLLQRVNGSAHFKGTAMNPYHDRLFLFASIFRLPYVQVQAVFALNIKAGISARMSNSSSTITYLFSMLYHWTKTHVLLFHPKEQKGLSPGFAKEPMRQCLAEAFLHQDFCSRAAIISAISEISGVKYLSINW